MCRGQRGIRRVSHFFVGVLFVDSFGSFSLEMPAGRIAKVGHQRLNAVLSFRRDVKIELRFLVLEMNGVIGLDLNRAQRIGAGGEEIGEVDDDEEDGDEEEGSADATH